MAEKEQPACSYSFESWPGREWQLPKAFTTAGNDVHACCLHVSLRAVVPTLIRRRLWQDVAIAVSNQFFESTDTTGYSKSRKVRCVQHA